ncbi:MAG: GAF domain-containing protein [Halobaculum sp.]
MESGEVKLVQPIADDPSIPEAIRQAAFADGLQSSLSIPLVYGDTVYGVVGVYSVEQDAFSGRERASFETLGNVAGFAINAARHRNLLLSDTVTELTLEYSGDGGPLAAASAAFDAELSVDWSPARRVTCSVTSPRGARRQRQSPTSSRTPTGSNGLA